MKLDLKGLTEAEKARAKRAAGEAIVEGINSVLDTSSSPVMGGQFKSLKADKTRSRLFEDGDMRAHISFEEMMESDHIEVGIFENAPEIERLKSYNHNKGDTLPKREFIPAPNKKFKTSIMKKANSAIDTVRAEAEEDAKIEQELINMILSDI